MCHLSYICKNSDVYNSSSDSGLIIWEVQPLYEYILHIKGFSIHFIIILLYQAYIFTVYLRLQKEKIISCNWSHCRGKFQSICHIAPITSCSLNTVVLYLRSWRTKPDLSTLALHNCCIVIGVMLIWTGLVLFASSSFHTEKSKG